MEKEQASRRQPAPRPHALHVDNRRQAALTGIKEVLSFDEKQIALSTDLGEAVLTGEGLHISRLTLEEGQLAVEGRIDGIFYVQPAKRRGLFRREKA